VWLVGCAGDWRRAAEVLFVGESLPWHFEADERAGQEVAGGVKGGAGTASGDVVGALCARDFKGVGSQYVDEGKCVVHCMAHGQANAEIMEDKSPTLSCNLEQPIITCSSKQQSQNIGVDVANALGANDYKEPQVVCYENHANDSRVTDSGNLSPTSTKFCGTGGGNLPLVKVTCARESGQGYWMEDEIAGTLRCEGENRPSRPSNVIANLDTMATQGVCYPIDTLNVQGRPSDNGRMGSGIGLPNDVSPTLTKAHHHGVGTVNLVRRLLPVECEKLMGFPPGWTDIKPNGKPTPDSPRYKACGNSWAVNCARWVMMRIQQSEDKYAKDTP
jgi:hypothetical protein